MEKLFIRKNKMEAELEYLREKHPNAEVFESIDKDFICVRTTLGSSNFGKDMIVPITNTKKYHIDTIRLQMIP